MTSLQEAAATTNNAHPSPATTETSTKGAPRFPPPKTDKPRPHVCMECTRSFARLEHLKRHERSHTKEKPFECNVCGRAFARRDLLLRHQQKLHASAHANARPKNGRMDSTTTLQGPGTGRGRKNSMAGSVLGSNGSPPTSMMRPRANTISHIDGASLNYLLQTPGRNHGYPIYGHMAGVSMGQIPDFNLAMAGYSHFNHQGIPPVPKIDTGLGLDINGGLKTAPALAGQGFDFDKIFGASSGSSTINPQQLHFGTTSEAPPASPFTTGFASMPSTAEIEGPFGWRAMEDNFMNEVAIDGSSPSAFSNGSASGFSEVMMDGSNQPNSASSAEFWSPTTTVTTSQFSNDAISSAVFPDMLSSNTLTPTTLTPGDLQHDPNNLDSFMSLNGMSSMSPIPGNSSLQMSFMQPPLSYGSDSVRTHRRGRPSSVTSVSSMSITDSTRSALLYCLAQPSGFGHTTRRMSISSPISPGFLAQPMGQQVKLPSTPDLQRYLNAYINFFHPHLPFIHLATLRFDSPTVSPSHHHPLDDSAISGTCCLILSMAAIGACYEYEHSVSAELFEHAKTMIKVAVDSMQRRTPMMVNNPMASRQNSKTPLWLVQAMLLNIVLGHQSGDRVSAEVATTTCASLVSLAKDADLDQPDPDVQMEEEKAFFLRYGTPEDNMNMSEDSKAQNEACRREFSGWFRWKSREERKRTLYCVFVLSCLLVAAYNQHPRILNSELHMDLPCEEDVWNARSPASWIEAGGLNAAQSRTLPFQDALAYLLSAQQRRQANNMFSAQNQSAPLHISTLGCYILINALHVHLWESRQQHQGSRWTEEETEALQAQVTAALAEWQNAWTSNPNHSLERPGPHGPLPADSIPLLDLCYVRLFVNLGRSKESFWLWDFDAMAEELATGNEFVPGVSDSDSDSLDLTSDVRKMEMSEANGDHATDRSTKREKLLRKAAFYAADSLTMADKLGHTFAEFTSRELPMQAAMCAFDCAQILAEWLATVQERVGRYLHGVLGRDEVDLGGIAAIMTLSDEDQKLLLKVRDILHHANAKISVDLRSRGIQPDQVLAPMKMGGYAYHLLQVTAYMLDRAGVWGITRVMAKCMRVHSEKLKLRAEASVLMDFSPDLTGIA